MSEMPWDYFTVEQYRKQMGDSGNMGSEDILQAQDEVIDYLERWAHTAWPSVGTVPSRTGTVSQGATTLQITTGELPESAVGTHINVVGAGELGIDLYTTISAVTDPTHVELTEPAGSSVVGALVSIDGEGEAARPRVVTERKGVYTNQYILTNAPVLSLVDSDVALGDTHYLNVHAGVIEAVGLYSPTLVEVTYEYGHVVTPRAVRRACIEATASLVRGDGGSRIPSNTSEYTTEGTTIVLDSIATDEYPWPWDSGASRSMRVYWERRRPRTFLAV